MNQNKSKSHWLRRVLLGRPEMGTLLPLALLLAVVACINASFFNLNNILDILRTASFSFMIAVPLTFLIAGGGMDLSVGAATSFGGVICALCLKAGVPLVPAILLAVLVGGLVGLVNGLIIVRQAARLSGHTGHAICGEWHYPCGDAGACHFRLF